LLDGGFAEVIGGGKHELTRGSRVVNQNDW